MSERAAASGTASGKRRTAWCGWLARWHRAGTMLHLRQLRSVPITRPSPHSLHRYVGPNQLMEETIALFMDPRYGIKASQVGGFVYVCSWQLAGVPEVGGKVQAVPAWRRSRPTSSPLTLSFYTMQALVRIPETLVCAYEFIMLPTPQEQVKQRPAACV